MHPLTQRTIAALLFVSTLVMPAFAQDDPTRDNNPPDPFGPPTGPRFPLPAPAVITTPDGFDNFDLGVDNAEPHMSNNPANPLWYFQAFNTNNPRYTIDGHNWTFNRPAFPNAAGDPVTCYDSLGNLYYQTMKSPITGTWVARSTDGGRTWGTPVSSVNGNDKNWMCADQTSGPYANYLYSSMTNSGAGGASFARSIDFGATWQQTDTLRPHALPGTMPAVGPNKGTGFDIPGGCVYAVTHSGSNAAGVYTFFRSTDGGLNFEQRSQHQFSNLIGTEISGRSTVQNMRCRPYPFITVDNSYGPFRGRVYLVYASNNPAGNGNKSDIFIRHSDDQCSTWTAPRVVNDDPNSQNNFQFHPAIWCEKSSGRLYVKFYDTRRVPTSDSMDVYATYSDDGGITFAPNQRLTNRTFKINFRNLTGANYQGDYDAITSNPVTSLSVWTDFRSNNYGSYVAYFPDFAMLASPAADTLRPTDSTFVQVKVPAVKLWGDRVRFTASVSPPAPFTFFWPRGDTLRTFPDSVGLRIRGTNVPEGVYTVTIQGEGPNGTPVHRRTVTLRVQFIPNALALQRPAGGEVWFAGASQQVRWTRTGDVDSVRLEYSVNNGSTWTTMAARHPADSVYRWTIPNAPSTQAKVRVSWLDSSSVSSENAVPFRISTPSPLATLNRDSLVATLDRGSNTFRDTLRIGNTGALPLTWTFADTMAWFAVAPASGTTPVDSIRTAVATFSSAGLSAGTYRGTLTMTSNDTIGGTRRLPVRLTVVARAAIEISATGFSYGSVIVADTAARSLTVRNRGTDTLVLGSIGLSQEPEYGSTATGGQVVPPAISSGTGTVRAGLQGVGGAQLAYTIRVSGLGGPVTSAAFRGGARGTNGPVLYTVPFTGDSAVGTWRNTGGEPFTPALRDSVKAGRVYLEVRTAAFPNGEIRGQLDGAFFTTLVPVRLAPGDSVVRQIRFSPVAPASYTGTLSIASNDPDPADDTLLVALTGTGIPRPTGVAEERTGVPEVYAVDQNFPNPFNPTTRIDFAVPEDAFVTLRVFNLLGQELAVLVNGERSAGYHSAVWDARSAGSAIASGMYFYRFEAKGVSGKPYSAIRKMLLVK